MHESSARCVLLADRHHGLSEGVRSLLDTMFEVVVMVADEPSLIQGASRLAPDLAVVDLSLAREGGTEWLRRLHEGCPGLKIIVVSVHDEPAVAQAIRAAGAHGFVVKRALATDLLPAARAVLAGGHYP